MAPVKSIFVQWLAMLALLASCEASAAGAKQLIDVVLKKADDAFIAERYTQPAHNNAYDRYRAVLMIDPENARAKAGLLAVRDAYLALAEQELTGGSEQHARYFAGLLKELYVGDEKVVALNRRVSALPPKPMPEVSNYFIKELPLPEKALAQRGPDIKALLVQVAQRVEQSRESVIILARNDAEGRWIYQQLNAATPDFRVRGDIRIAAKPAIHLQEPL